MYLHAIANSKNRLANSEYCWIKPGSIFCIHRIRPSRDDNSTVDLSKRVSGESLTANFYTRSTDSASSCFWYIVDIYILSQLINILLKSLIILTLLQCVEASSQHLFVNKHNFQIYKYQCFYLLSWYKFVLIVFINRRSK